MMRSGSFCRCNHFLIGCIESSVANILHDGSFKQPGILQYHTKCIAQFSSVEVFDIVIIQQNRTTVYIIETHEQFYHCCLSGSGRSYDCDLLTRLYLSTEIIDNDLLRIITKMHMIKGNFACDGCNICRIFYNLYFLFFIQKFKYTLRCSRHRLYHIDDLCNLLNWLGKVLYILNERLNITDRNYIFNCEQTTGQCHTCISKVSDKHHDWLHHAG